MSEQRRRGYFVDPEALHRISLKPFDGSDHWVDIQAELSEPDYRFLSDTMINIVNTTDRKNPDQSRSTTLLDSKRHFVELFRRVVRAWSLTDVIGPDGLPLMPGATNPATGEPVQPMPLNVMSFSRITGVGDYLSKQIDNHYREQRMTEEERGNAVPLLNAGSLPAAVADYRSEPSESWSANGSESHTIEGTAYPIPS